MRIEIYLFIFLLVYFFFVFFLRSYLLWKRTGVNPLTFSKTDDAHGYNGKVFTFISLLELAVVFIYAFKNEWYQYLLPFWYLEYSYLNYIGWGLLMLSLVLVWAAQSQANVGLFLVIPNAFILLIVSLSTVTINTQIRLEEAFLVKSHGKSYTDYCLKVRRWF